MTTLKSQLNPRSADFQANVAAMQTVVDDLHATVDKIALGGPDTSTRNRVKYRVRVAQGLPDRALELRAYDGVSLVYVNNRPVPQPAPGEVLVTLGAGDVFRLGEALVDGGGE